VERINSKTDTVEVKINILKDRKEDIVHNKAQRGNKHKMQEREYGFREENESKKNNGEMASWR
jgi:hypothetical protein